MTTTNPSTNAGMDRTAAPRAILAALDGDEAELGRVLSGMSDHEREDLARAADNLAESAREPGWLIEIAKEQDQSGMDEPHAK